MPVDWTKTAGVGTDCIGLNAAPAGLAPVRLSSVMVVNFCTASEEVKVGTTADNSGLCAVDGANEAPADCAVEAAGIGVREDEVDIERLELASIADPKLPRDEESEGDSDGDDWADTCSQ